MGRDLEHTLIIDNTPENFYLHKSNGIFIKTWFGDQKDTELE